MYTSTVPSQNPIYLPLVFIMTQNYPSILFQENTQNFFGAETQQQTCILPSQLQVMSYQTEPSKTPEEHRTLVKMPKARRNYSQKQNDQEFQVRSVSSQGVIYKKKNTESNIINQVISYLSTNKSRNKVFRVFNNSEKKVQSFYLIMAKLKQSNKKYINRKFIKNVMGDTDGGVLEKALTRAKKNVLEIKEVKKVLRILIFEYLRNLSNMALLTSSKIDKSTLPEHFWRKREILKFLFDPHSQQI